jgi:hypothetical protein
LVVPRATFAGQSVTLLLSVFPLSAEAIPQVALSKVDELSALSEPRLNHEQKRRAD